MAHRIIVGPSAALRSDALAEAWQDKSVSTLIVAPSFLAGRRFLRAHCPTGAAWMGHEVETLPHLAHRLATPALAREGRVLAGQSALALLASQVLARAAGAGTLPSFREVIDKPGLPHAMVASVEEMRQQGCVEGVRSVRPEVYQFATELSANMDARGVVDLAGVFERAQVAPAQKQLLLLDVYLHSKAVVDFVAGLAKELEVCAVLPSWDEESAGRLSKALCETPTALTLRGSSALSRAQRQLFGKAAEDGKRDASLEVFSAPGEHREAVEIARRVLAHGREGVAFEEMAVVVRAPEAYRAHLEEAFRRARVPLHLTRGARRPDPAGRALLALIDCALEGLSASRFAEYLSLSVAPKPGKGGSEIEVPADPIEDVGEEALEEEDEGGFAPTARWEKFLVEASVLGGVDRWKTRLAGLRERLSFELSELQDAGDPRAEGVEKRLEELGSLERVALPMMELLASFPEEASWKEWSYRLGELARRALRRPERVMALLAGMSPLAELEKVTLRTVRRALTRGLSSIVIPPKKHARGAVFVGTPEDVRGLSFRLVFVPGLAEKVFPPKVLEDPILLDRHRRAISDDLPTNEDRLALERLRLSLAVGAARETLVASYPRLDSEQARPRVPSFYALELLRAGEGTLLGFSALAERARDVAAASLRWPAPGNASDAIDETEFDLAVLEKIMADESEGSAGAARYLIETSAHLTRALRARGRRFRSPWSHADGLHKPGPEALALLSKHRLAARPYSATALQSFAACPYRFFLRAILRLSPRDTAEAIEELDPLQRGSLVHDAQFRALSRLRDEGLLPLSSESLDPALVILEECLEEVAAEYKDTLCPAIDRVWEDGVALLLKDLKQWLVGLRGQRWDPMHFELAFGLPNRGDRDPDSTEEPLDLSIGLCFRGSIDLVEGQEGRLRATDHKTGKKPPKRALRVGGGEILQPVLYALALEELFPGRDVVNGGLSFCTERGGFFEERVELDDGAREAAAGVVKTIDTHVERGFFPAAPNEDACVYCDYQGVCGPGVERRWRYKRGDELKLVDALRRKP